MLLSKLKSVAHRGRMAANASAPPSPPSGLKHRLPGYGTDLSCQPLKELSLAESHLTQGSDWSMQTYKGLASLLSNNPK